MLATAARLFQVEFRRVDDAQVWHPDVVTYDVYEDGSDSRMDRATLIGRFYLDMHPREGKDKWFAAHRWFRGFSITLKESIAIRGRFRRRR